MKFNSFPVNTIFVLKGFAFRAAMYPCQMLMHS